jgi:transposase
LFGIGSQRLPCREVKVNMAYRWFCGLSIADTLPDHLAFSHARNERFRASDIFRRVFQRGVEACIASACESHRLPGGEVLIVVYGVRSTAR